MIIFDNKFTIERIKRYLTRLGKGSQLNKIKLWWNRKTFKGKTWFGNQSFQICRAKSDKAEYKNDIGSGKIEKRWIWCK